VLHIYDAFYKQDTIQHVLVRHEQAAVHAADGYARATGDVGVALVTSGPGVTNAVTGIATAYMDSIPMVIITGQVPTAAIGLDAFQECDTVGITRPIVKHNFLVKDVRTAGRRAEEGLPHRPQRPPRPGGGGHPEGRLVQQDAYTGYPDKVEMRSYKPVHKGHGGQIRKALQLLMNGQAAVHLHRRRRGPGQRHRGTAHAGQPARLSRCTNTLMGLGAISGTDPKFLGMLGMHGTIEANNAMQNCDVLLAVGARFDDRVIGNPKHFASSDRKIIHIDVDPSSISKRVKVDIPIVGDVKDVLNDLIATIRESAPSRTRARWARGGNRSTAGASATACATTAATRT
jgi:acetolactate synthase-1/2/3 large subunit